MDFNSDFAFDAPIQSGVLVWMLGHDGNGEFFSPSWLAFVDRRMEDCQDNRWLDDVHPDCRAKFVATIEAAFGSRLNFRQQIRLHRKDNTYVWHLCEGIVRIDTTGAFAGLICVCSDVTRQIQESVEAELNGRHFVDLLPQSDMVALALDNAGHPLFFNSVLTDVLGCPAGELGDAPILERFLDRQHLPLSEILFPQGKRSDQFPAMLESEFIAGRESRHVFLWYLIPLRDYSGESSGMILIGDDVTEKRYAEEQLRITSQVFETTDLAMIITDRQGAIISANNAFSRLTGYNAEEAVGNNPRMLQSGRHDKAFYNAMWQSLLSEGRWQGEIWDKRKDGTVYPKFLSICALRNELGVVTHFSGLFYDISERKAVEERLSRLAHFDGLTELPNRLFLLDKLAAVCHAAALNKQRFAVLFLDLDHFKVINDTMGHYAGDELLRWTAKRLRDSIRSQDVAARIGGDEFMVLLTDVKDWNNAEMVAQKIIESFSLPLAIDGKEVVVTTSIGIALCPDDAGDPQTLMRLADQAMYRAKAAGRNTIRFFSPNIQSRQ